jgi:hypothetical protein
VASDALRGTRDARGFDVRRMPLDPSPTAQRLEKPLDMRLRGYAALLDVRFADARRGTFDLAFRGGADGPIAVELRPRDGTDVAVDALLRHDLEARLVSRRVFAAGPGKPWFEWYVQEKAAFFRLLLAPAGALGPLPTIVHGYAPFE